MNFSRPNTKCSNSSTLKLIVLRSSNENGSTKPEESGKIHRLSRSKRASEPMQNPLDSVLLKREVSLPQQSKQDHKEGEITDPGRKVVSIPMPIFKKLASVATSLGMGFSSPAEVIEWLIDNYNQRKEDES